MEVKIQIAMMYCMQSRALKKVVAAAIFVSPIGASVVNYIVQYLRIYFHQDMSSYHDHTSRPLCNYRYILHDSQRRNTHPEVRKINNFKFTVTIVNGFRCKWAMGNAFSKLKGLAPNSNVKICALKGNCNKNPLSLWKGHS